MNVVKLDTLDHRCPDVMIMARRFLRVHVTDDNICEIVTQEPSSMRDILYYCNYQDLTLLKTTKREDGRYILQVTKGNTPSLAHMATQPEPIKVIDALSSKVKRINRTN
jgi:TusA-related sulfurtransferase